MPINNIGTTPRKTTSNKLYLMQGLINNIIIDETSDINTNAKIFIVFCEILIYNFSPNQIPYYL